ncbi:MAG: peptidoglycan-associated lipoprotein Pal [Betaproteobacteria bacterium]
MNKLVLAVAVAAFLSACGSAVKLDDVSVEDKSGQAVALTELSSAGNTTSGSTAKSQTAVTTLDAAKSGSDLLVAGGRTVYFDYDSYAIRPEFQSVIEAHARILKGDKTKKASIEGHTDERGGREYNLALGQKRAEAVRKALSLLGVSENQMEAVSFGKEKPAMTGGSEAAMEKNRRAEIAIR